FPGEASKARHRFLLRNARCNGLYAFGVFGITNDPFRISTFSHGAYRFSENFSEQDDSLVGGNKMLQRVDRNRPLAFLCLLIVWIPLCVFIAMVFSRQRTIIGVTLSFVFVRRNTTNTGPNLVRIINRNAERYIMRIPR